MALGGGIRDGLITNQNRFDRDWDGEWKHAVRETDDGWYVELLIPWSTVSKRESGAERRTVSVYGSRFLFDRSERYACPAISSESAVFLSDFRRIEIAQFESRGTFDFVPYGTAISDLLNDHTDFKAGADINWDPSPNFRLAATLNPDFGQVESDELVVDFSAIETVFTDKRPFFTENQGIFELTTPANGQLVYTRRVGAAPDDGSAGSSEIDGALKVTGTVDKLVYGAFLATEDNYDKDIGRQFVATRVALPFPRARVGYLGSWTDRPVLDRDALVNAIDYEITPNAWWRVAGQVIRSDIDVAGLTTDGYEAWLQTDFARSSPLSHTLKLLYIDDRFDMNDLGYLERNSLEQAEWITSRRLASSSAEDRISGENQRLYLLYRENTAGERLQSRIQASRDVLYASNWRSYQDVRFIPHGVDDVISRGNGPVKLDSRVAAYVDMTSPRRGDWQFLLGGYLFQQGVDGYSAWLQFVTTWYAHENLTLRLDLLPQWSDDWLLWQESNLFGSFGSERLDFDLRLDWIPAPKHEVRLKWQWIGIDADIKQAYRTTPTGTLVPVDERLSSFTVSNLGLQLRYRYEIGPMSEFFIVYARGGFDLLDDDDREVRMLFRDMSDVRDSDQFLIKIRYRL